jgi:hypothetical protein
MVWKLTEKLIPTPVGGDIRKASRHTKVSVLYSTSNTSSVHTELIDPFAQALQEVDFFYSNDSCVSLLSLCDIGELKLE